MNHPVQLSHCSVCTELLSSGALFDNNRGHASHRTSRIPPSSKVGISGVVLQTFSVTVTLITATTLLTVPVLVNPMLPRSVTVSKYLLTMTLIPFPEGVTVTKDVCTAYQYPMWTRGRGSNNPKNIWMVLNGMHYPPFSPPHPVLEVARTAPTLVEKSGAAADRVSLSWQSPADLRKHMA